jgi:hypothetical protein
MRLTLFKERAKLASILLLAGIFIVQVFSFIVSNEVNGIHLGKRHVRLSPPVKQSVAFQMKYETLEDISVGSSVSGHSDQTNELDRLSENAGRFEPTGGSLSYPLEKPSLSRPSLITLLRVYRI